MISPNEGNWAPSPELLAAYFDGEFEGRDDLACLRKRLEAWLESSSNARSEVCAFRQLRQLWQETSPQEPSSAAWQKIQSELSLCSTGNSSARTHPVKPSSVSYISRRAVLLWIGAACLLLSTFFFNRLSPIPNDDEPFPVASEREVVILHVEGADTGTLVVGELPLYGPLELIGPGEVTLTSIQPAQRDNMIPEVHIGGPGAPIIWARAEENSD
jgi:hypothetical protein